MAKCYIKTHVKHKERTCLIDVLCGGKTYKFEATPLDMIHRLQLSHLGFKFGNLMVR